MFISALMTTLVALSLGLVSAMTIPSSGYGLPTNGSVIACANGDSCIRAATAWKGCTAPSPNGIAFPANFIQSCLCEGLQFPGWETALGDCIGCLENGNPFMTVQFNSFLLQFCLPGSTPATLNLGQFEKQAYDLGVWEQFPLLLPDATLINSPQSFLFDRRQVATGGVLDDAQEGFVGDHLPVHFKEKRATPLTTDSAGPAATSAPSSSRAQVCEKTRCCKNAAAVFHFCLEDINDYYNNTVTWDCLCKTYGTYWKEDVNDCAACIEPAVISSTTGAFTKVVSSTMDAYCNFTTADSSTNALLALGNRLTVQYQSPLSLFNMTIPTGPVLSAGP